MKKIIVLCALICLSHWSFGQDVFQEFLFPGEFILNNKESINLTPRQEGLIKAIHNENQSSFSQKRQALQQENEQLRIMLDAEKAEPSLIYAQLDRVLAKENELKKMQFITLLTMRSHLNSKQVAQLKVLKQADSSSGLSRQNNEVVSIRAKGADSGKPPVYYISYKGKYHRITDLNSLEPLNLESITVLKGEAAIEKFGSEGNNGAIIIILKNPENFDFDKLR